MNQAEQKFPEKILRKYETKSLSKNRIAILSDARRETFEELKETLKDWHISTSTNLSSIGHLENGKLAICVKPKSRQGMKSAGIENETFFIEKMNQLLTEPKTVTFQSEGKTLSYKDVCRVLHVGGDTKGRQKADVILETKNGKISLSLKKDSAEIWESADRYYGKKANRIITDLLDSKTISAKTNGDIYKLSQNVALRATEQECRDVIFGSDILPHGAVLKASFCTDSFTTNGDEIRIQCSTIISCLDDLTEKTFPWFLIRNDCTRRSKHIGYNGLRVLSVYGSRINKNVLKVQ